MTERDIKLLWGRSGNRCAICKEKTELSQDKKLSSEKYPLGEQAHIVGEKESAARGKSNLSEQERDGYSNRILLCPNHHTEIDRDEQYYSVERLHLIKQEHELWVQGRLSQHTDTKKQAEELVYSALLDAAVADCFFTDWNMWTAGASGSLAQWPEQVIDGVAKFNDRICRAAWPGSRPELERALKTLALTLSRAKDKFLLHADCGRTQRGVFDTVPFYKLQWHEQAVYDRLLAKYEEWWAECSFWIVMATKAANWVSDVVRRDINPLFFALEGRFTHERNFDGVNIPEFSVSEKRSLPKNLERHFSRFKKNATDA